jgi:serine/threonine protein kinase
MAARPQSSPDLPIEVEEPRPSRLVGTVIGGRYRVIRQLAAGGLGVVYEAKHIELERVVALKVLSDEIARNAEVIKRFQREAQTASQIGHPNIVDVHDFGRTNDGFPYLAMEKLEGYDFDHELERDVTVAPERVVDILAQVASALDAVHKRGVVHRDIKPANIFLSRRIDGSEQVKLLDFGLAAFHEQSDRLTQMGSVVGTPHYMPPEAAEGELAGPQGDVYSLAVVAYEAICGVLPFDAELATGVLVKKVARPAPTMSARTNKQYPLALEKVLARALSREPEKRPSTAGDLVAKLREAIQSTALAEPDTSTPEVLPSDDGKPEILESQPMPQLPTKKSAIPLLAGIVAVLLLGAAAVAGWAVYGNRDEETPRTIVRDETPAPREAELDVPAEEPPAVAEQPAPVDPEPPPPVVVQPEPPVQQQARTEPRRPNVARPQQPEVPQEAAPVRDRAAAEQLAGEGQRALFGGNLSRALELLTQASNADPSYARTYRLMGLVHKQLGHRPEAARAFNRYLTLAPNAADADTVRQHLAEVQ